MKNDKEVLIGSLALARDVFVEGVDRVEAMHRAIAGKPFGALAATPVAAPAAGVRAIHDGIGAGVYAAVRGIGAGVVGGAIAAATLAPQTWSRHPGWRRLRENGVSALNGAFGDRLHARANPLALGLDFRVDGHRVAPTPDALAAAYPDAGGRIVVFVHGLCCSEDSWNYGRSRRAPEAGRPYAERLAADLGCTPVFVRYNTGLPIAENGPALSEALDALFAAWPVPVERIDIVGHSMGGLVGRAALAYGAENARPWAGRTHWLVCLGSPHRGSPLEKIADFAAGLLDTFEVTRPLARIADGRSAGIRDLGWRDVGPRPDGCRIGLVAAGMGGTSGSVASRIVGDGLVRLPSALASELGADSVEVLAGLHHLDLLNHPAVYPTLESWLGDEAEAPEQG